MVILDDIGRRKITRATRNTKVVMVVIRLKLGNALTKLLVQLVNVR